MIGSLGKQFIITKEKSEALLWKTNLSDNNFLQISLSHDLPKGHNGRGEGRFWDLDIGKDFKETVSSGHDRANALTHEFTAVWTRSAKDWVNQCSNVEGEGAREPKP